MFEAIECILNKPFKYEVFNLGNSSPVTLGEVLKTIEEVTGKKINTKIMPSRKGEMEVTYADISKAKRLLGYNPTTSIKESVKIFYDWYLKQDENYKKGNL